MVRDLLVRTTDRKWGCKSCNITFVSPTDVRRHIIAKHFSGPMCRCKHCGKYSKNEVALSKHISRRHRAETQKELSEWQITKYKAKNANPHKRPPDLPPAPPPSPLKTEPGELGSGSKPVDTRFMARISNKLSKFNELSRKSVRRALNFEEMTDVKRTGYMCEVCSKVFLNKHDAIIHQLEVCLRKKPATDTAYIIKKPVFEPSSPIDPPLRPQSQTTMKFKSYGTLH